MDQGEQGRRYRRTDAVIEADVAGEIVLLNTGDWQYYEFDAVGTAIWQLLAAPNDLAGLVAALTARFAVDPERCARETVALLDDMMARGLVTATT